MEAFELLSVFLGKGCQIVAGNGENVAAARLERRHFQRNDVQAIKQVFAETPFGDFGLRIAVGGADNADVRCTKPVLAEPLHLTGLQKAQELGLQGQIHVADFVEEQRAAIGLQGRAIAFGRRAGERALHMAENLAFQQILGDGSAVEGDEWTFCPARQQMEGFGANFLARTAFAGHEYSGIGGSSALDDAVNRLHGLRPANEIAERVRRLNRRRLCSRL